MAKDGLHAALCALSVVLLPSVVAAGPVADSVADRIAVQQALQRGRELLAKRSYEAAVQTLEAQLDRINGSREYLAALRDAYREYVRELRLANRESEAQVYQRRLQILDPGAVLDGVASRPAAAAPAMDKQAPLARAAMGEDATTEKPPKPREVDALLAQANQAFDQEHFDVAARLFAKANQSDAAATAACRERWAYCLVHQVVLRLNQQAKEAPPYQDLAKEVRLALSLAPNNPKLKGLGAQVLGQIEERLGGKGGAGATASVEAGPAVNVRHAEKPYQGWHVAETANFRIFHNESRELVDQVAQSAEKSRMEAERKWFGGGVEIWKPPCEIVLWANADDYSKQTRFPRNYPGHSKIESRAGRVLSRRIELHCDERNMLASVLPHEVTHVVLAGKFGEKPLPRWADEGMAVQSEPREHIEKHLRNLPQFRQDRQLFSVRQLMQMDDYPNSKSLGAFYAESVSLVDFLTHKRGPQVFAEFVRDGLYDGFEKALAKHYAMTSFDELEQQWLQYTFRDTVATGKPAERVR
jgi:hypothetical protein